MVNTALRWLVRSCSVSAAKGSGPVLSIDAVRMSGRANGDDTGRLDGRRELKAWQCGQMYSVVNTERTTHEFRRVRSLAQVHCVGSNDDISERIVAPLALHRKDPCRG